MFIVNAIPVNGARLNTRIEGAEGKPWVTFVTGIANDLSMWDGQIASLERDFRILRYDLRGQGGSQASKPPYSVDLLTQDLFFLLDQLQIKRTHLVGLGLGGCVVQSMAIEHPERVDKLLPCCCRAQMVPEFAAMWHKLLEAVEKGGVEAIVEQTAQRWFSEDFKARHPDVLDKVRRMIAGTSKDGYLGCAGAFVGLSLESNISKIKAETLYVSGADDKLGGPPALMAGLAAKVPGARHVSVPGAAHIANIQNPEGFNAVIGEFLR